jgi:hypothetical protein
MGGIADPLLIGSNPISAFSTFPLKDSEELSISASDRIDPTSSPSRSKPVFFGQ